MDETLPNDEERKQDILKTLEKLDGIIMSRTETLSTYERVIFQKITKGEISLLNMSGQKARAIKMARESPTLELECRILRRSLFCLKHRRDSLRADLEKLQQSDQSSLAG
jgi:hypothetical protein